MRLTLTGFHGFLPDLSAPHRRNTRCARRNRCHARTRVNVYRVLIGAFDPSSLAGRDGAHAKAVAAKKVTLKLYKSTFDEDNDDGSEAIFPGLREMDAPVQRKHLSPFCFGAYSL